MKQCFTVYSMSAFIFIQYTDSLMRSCVFSMLMWLLCNCSEICFCKRKGIIIYFPFIALSSIFPTSCLIGQYFSDPGSTPSLVCIHPLILYYLSICISTYSSVADFMSSIEVHIGRFTVVLIACTLMFIPDISWSFSLNGLAGQSVHYA